MNILVLFSKVKKKKLTTQKIKKNFTKIFFYLLCFKRIMGKPDLSFNVKKMIIW